MKNVTQTNGFEKILTDLLSEESKGSRLEIPLSIYERIVEVQLQYKKIFDLKITREKVLLLMILEGIDKLQSKLNDIEQAVETMER